MNESSPKVAVLIVGYRNPEDVRNCLTALALATPKPSFDIFVCENGGQDAFEELNNALLDAQGPCDICSDLAPSPLRFSSNRFVEVKCLALKGRATLVWIARASHNLGYAGAVNAWTKQLLNIPGWDGLWLLNPDSMPYPNALDALVSRAVTTNKGMISSTIVPADDCEVVHNRGLRWNSCLATAVAIGRYERVDAHCDIAAVEAAMDSPSGASMYVTRACTEQIGPMDEQFFLYFEDLDWGIRANESGLGYAQQSIVPHTGGTTIGKSSVHRANRSKLSVYLQQRNMLMFVRKHRPWLLPHANIMALGYAFLYLASGAPSNFVVALQAILAAWSGEIGPPSNLGSGDWTPGSIVDQGPDE